MTLRRLPLRLKPDPRRVVVRPFNIAAEPRDLTPTDLPRASRIVDRVARLDTAAVAEAYDTVWRSFHPRHRFLLRVLDRRIEQLGSIIDCCGALDLTARRLVAAHFCHEYSFESSALFNPSIVPHYRQEDVPDGSIRFILSLRSIGEGHISSVNFRTGLWTPGDGLEIEPASDAAQVAETPGPYGLYDEHGAVLLSRPPDLPLNELVIFPMTPAQRNGVEDLRLTLFTDDDGAKAYFGTYTAFSGAAIASELLITPDFHSFRMLPLRGSAAVNKGMAFFPRRIDGAYAMLARIDNEHIYIARSTDLANWTDAVRVIEPKYPWEFVQLGNCGSPVEIDEGWLVLTHGVGAMRQYALGACLLDRKDPSRLVARTPAPIMQPSDDEREGYVPNVLYTCGFLVRGRSVLIPYGISDFMTGFAVTTVDALLEMMRPE